MATKAELRTHFLALRRSLSTNDVDTSSRLITSLFFDTIVLGGEFKSSAKAFVLHTFLPIKRQNEVDTWPIIHQIWQDYPHVQIAVSVTDTQSGQLAHYILTSTTKLAENRWGIPEPTVDDQREISVKRIDVVLVPLLAVDNAGHRVGYGGGFYDRFLAECRPDCIKVGLSLFDPAGSIADVEPTDIPLDFCITPNKLFNFGV
ncbi:5-formyltetrahydrofolate cyclo-ligase [Spirosoma fluminis]